MKKRIVTRKIILTAIMVLVLILFISGKDQQPDSFSGSIVSEAPLIFDPAVLTDTDYAAVAGNIFEPLPLSL